MKGIDVAADPLSPPAGIVPAEATDAALDRIAAASEDLRRLARAERLPMLEYLLGMVVIEARNQRARGGRRPPGVAVPR